MQDHPAADDGRPLTRSEQAIVDGVLALLHSIHAEVHTGTGRYQRPPLEPIGPSSANYELERLLAEQQAAGAEARARAAVAERAAALARRAAADAQAAADRAQTEARHAISRRVRATLPGAA